jgi:hypothetical protein
MPSHAAHEGESWLGTNQNVPFVARNRTLGGQNDCRPGNVCICYECVGQGTEMLRAG